MGIHLGFDALSSARFMATVYIIGGANGAGKTTTALAILSQRLNVVEFVNADSIAAGLSPLNFESMAIQI